MTADEIVQEEEKKDREFAERGYRIIAHRKTPAFRFAEKLAMLPLQTEERETGKALVYRTKALTARLGAVIRDKYDVALGTRIYRCMPVAQKAVTYARQPIEWQCGCVRICPQCYFRRLYHVYQNLTADHVRGTRYFGVWNLFILPPELQEKSVEAIKKAKARLGQHLRRNLGVRQGYLITRIVVCEEESNPRLGLYLGFLGVVPPGGIPRAIMCGGKDELKPVKFGPREKLADLAYTALYFTPTQLWVNNVAKTYSVHRLGARFNQLSHFDSKTVKPV